MHNIYHAFSHFPLELVLASILASLLVGVVKGGFSGIMALLGVPIIALSTTPQEALAILLPLMCVMDFVAVIKYRGQWSIKKLRSLIPSSFTGIAIGSYFISILSGAYIRLFIAIIAFQFCLRHVLNRLQKKDVSPKENPIKTISWGFLSGVSSAVAHAGGPALHAYLLPQKLEKTQYQSTVNAYYLIINCFKIIPYTLIGLLTLDTLLISLISLPFAVIGTYVGIWLHYRISQALFYRIAYIAFFLTGCKLTYDALSELLY